MPSGKAAAIREAVAKENRADLQLERTPWGKTGFVNVVEVKGKYQARLQVPGDGRGGSVKRKQHPLPGLFDTAEEAAVWLAVVKRDMKAQHNGKLFAPPKIDKPHKPRAKPAVPPQWHHRCLCSRLSCQWPLQWPCPCCFRWPICHLQSPCRSQCSRLVMRECTFRPE